MSNEKYFSVDVSNDIHIVNLHETLEQAKQSCLDGAIEAHDFADDMCDHEDFASNDLPNAVYGIVLGKAVCKEKQLSEEEKEDYGSDLVLEKPELVELPQDNNWISVKEKLPEAYTHVLVYTIAAETISLFYDGEKFLFYPYTYGLEKITHWQPLPTKPIQ
ncbi:DUF551 domain-containing protein [Pasteurella multocida]|uniref:DUF551 domain-containing protein n=4 Tax=Pasteurella multocida TaxID=747 RepID=A0AAW8V981_PASMD|nr:DUF551 domain-containing protein [Pasteurella multocida]ARA69628.1 hypothetical protein BTV67_03470 [Pasteurella multocida subsp. multocida]ARA70823.1 hypothetical protein BTV67_10015 [Pasteurella multocida subsp. multocida]ARA88724.1 hypothetical protein BTV66_03485 [Pasteurella multocida subsp. septica]ARA90185.1 hypothetical protein BTV66_11575 [Pasteurella multocida subsp. septica]AUK50049.1 hypothetical protein A4210_10045 [Pasteurella multocida]